MEAHENCQLTGLVFFTVRWGTEPLSRGHSRARTPFDSGT